MTIRPYIPALAVAALLVSPLAAFANSASALGFARSGCTGNGCHALTASPTTRVCIEGLPGDGTYAPGTTYTLNVFVDGVSVPTSSGWATAWVDGRVAGFAFEASSGEVAAADATVSAFETHATHDAELGNHRNHWTVEWTAPSSGNVTLWLSGNAVNNSGASDAGDLWNSLEVMLSSGAGDGAGEGLDCNPPLPLPQLVPRPLLEPAMAAH